MRIVTDIVIDEVEEEAGFVVPDDRVEFVGKVFVSTQMNQFCYLYLVFVDKNKQGEKKPENKIEAMATTKWMDEKTLLKLNDWKAIAILSKARMLRMI